jgi:hypothetical protein
MANSINHLDYLIEVARKYRDEHGFPEEERCRQVRSFAYGNTRIENEQITKSDIDKAVDSLRSERGTNKSTTVCS